MPGTTNALNNSSTVFQVDDLNLNRNDLATTTTNTDINLLPNGLGKISQDRPLVGSPVAILNSNTNNTNAASDAYIQVLTGGGAGGDPYLTLGIAAVRSYALGIDNSNSDVLVETTSAASISTPSSGTVLRQMTSAGSQTLPLQPAFFAYRSTPLLNVTGDGSSLDVIFDTELFDQQNNYNATTGVFTAPKTGKYSFSSGILYLQAILASQCQLLMNIEAITYIYGPFGSSFVGNFQCAASWIVSMAEGDTCSIEAQVSGGAKTVDIYGDVATPSTYFCGALIC